MLMQSSSALSPRQWLMRARAKRITNTRNFTDVHHHQQRLDVTNLITPENLALVRLKITCAAVGGRRQCAYCK